MDRPVDNHAYHDQEMFFPGQRVALQNGSYRVLDKLGEGGQSSVWKAQRETDGEFVAIRTVNLFDIGHHRRDARTQTEIDSLVEYADEEIRFLKSFAQEDARQHYIVPVLDDGVITHSLCPGVALPTAVMPWYDRDDLDQFVRSRPRNQQDWAFSMHDLLRWARQLAMALNHIHRQHNTNQASVHRDVKPKNILLNSQGDIGLTDFGIVRASSSQATSSVVGSFAYCAPEQPLALYKKANGHKQYLITPAVDIYAFAITLHELLVGQTSAQKTLASRVTVEDHDHYLPPSGMVQSGRIGLLGKVGGLTTAEMRYLQQQLLSLMQPNSVNLQPQLTMVVGGNSAPSLPDAAFIAGRLADLMVWMLSPWPDDRPSAAMVLAALIRLEQCLNPRLDTFRLASTEQTLALGVLCTLPLEISGTGLPDDLQWLRLECNGLPLSAWQVMTDGTPSVYGLLADGVQTVRLEARLPKETGSYHLKVLAQVGGKTFVQECTCRVSLSATQLWEQGKVAEALKLEVRPEWLESLLDQTLTLNGALKLLSLFRSLQASHPPPSAANQHLQAALESLNQFRLKQTGGEASTPPPTSPAPSIATEKAPKPSKPLSSPSSPLPSPLPTTQQTNLKRLRYALVGLIALVLLAGVAALTYPWSLGREPAVVAVNTPAVASEPVVEKPLAPIKKAVVSAIPPALVTIAAGRFQMGCVEGRDDTAGACYSNEKPMRDVSVAAFQLGKNEVTFTEWEACEADGACPHADDQGHGRGNHPVINVSWDDIQTYMTWLNAQTGKTYRLPTEAEWEYAARGGKTETYPWGNAATHEFANYGQESCCGGLTDGKDKWIHSAPVGSFPANAFGLQDMHGNVWEWCADAYTEYSSAPDSAQNNAAITSTNRVLRGGSWGSNARFLRSAARISINPANRDPSYGFRLALTP